MRTHFLAVTAMTWMLTSATWAQTTAEPTGGGTGGSGTGALGGAEGATGAGVSTATSPGLGAQRGPSAAATELKSQGNVNSPDFNNAGGLNAGPQSIDASRDANASGLQSSVNLRADVQAPAPKPIDPVGPHVPPLVVRSQALAAPPAPTGAVQQSPYYARYYQPNYGNYNTFRRGWQSGRWLPGRR